MRILAAFFFFLTVPVVVFIATILYGGISATSLKQELADANIYDTLTAQVADFIINPESEGSEDEMSAQFIPIIENYVSASYVQEKTELFIDDTDLWMRGKTTTPPVISFKEVKEEILANNPNLIPQIELAMAEAKKAQASMEATDQEAMNNQIGMMESLIKSDFTIPAGEKIAGLKQLYQILVIALPVLVILLIINLAIITFFNKTTTARFRWLAVVLFVTAIYGFIIAISNTIIVSTISKILLAYDNQYVALFSPVFIKLTTLFVSQFQNYQTIVSLSFIGISVLFFILSFVIKPKTQTAPINNVAKTPSKKKSK